MVKFEDQSIRGRIVAAGGPTTGFDLLRVVLALAVICTHSIGTSYGSAADIAVLWESPFRGLFSLVLPMFFALSGFLVAGSLHRTPRMHQFLTLRAIRIVPALAVETLLCAVLLGPLLTSMALGDYFTDRHFFGYFLNIVGDIHYDLPGMFSQNPMPWIVNISLWTVPYELECYAILALLAVVGLIARRGVLTLLILGLCLVVPYANLAQDVPQTFLRPDGKLLVMSFLCGIAIQRYQDRLVHNVWLAAACCLLAVALLGNSNTALMAAPFAAYFTIYIGVLQAPKLPVFKNGDYSYGMYLFAFPMQQAYTQLFPDYRIWWLNAAFAIAASLAYAIFSWHCVEKPVLSRKRIILAFVDDVVRRMQRPFAPRPASNSVPA